LLTVVSIDLVLVEESICHLRGGKEAVGVDISLTVDCGGNVLVDDRISGPEEVHLSAPL
jgi:hypothetical protein